MLSHDLARLLLAHRNNDLRISVLNLNRDESDDRVVEKTTGLRNDRWIQDDYRTTAEGVLRYDSDSDTLHILAGYVVVDMHPRDVEQRMARRRAEPSGDEVS